MQVAQKGGWGNLQRWQVHVGYRRRDFRLVLALPLVCLLGGLAEEPSDFDARCQVLVPTLARVV